jgi:hypothetical protein
MSKADGTAFADALTANSLMFVKVNTSNDTAVVLGIVGAGSNVSANGSGSPVSYLNKLKIGSAIYDTSAIRPFSVSQIANNSVKIFVADIDQLDGKIIALSTGALTGTTSSAWSLNLVDTSGGAVSLDVSMLNADGTAFSDDISANELLFVAIDLTNYEGTVLSIAGASGGGGGVATSVVGTVENGTTASQAYAVGEHFIRNDKFCTAIAAIASGTTLTQGTNYVEGTIAEAIGYGGIKYIETGEINLTQSTWSASGGGMYYSLGKNNVLENILPANSKLLSVVYCGYNGITTNTLLQFTQGESNPRNVYMLSPTNSFASGGSAVSLRITYI